MLIIRPKEVGGLAYLESRLKPDLLNNIDGFLKEGDLEPLAVPKFEIETNVNILKEVLTEMGIKELFNSDDPSLLHISQVLHKNAILVNEKGASKTPPASPGIFLKVKFS